jgi:hypothetical protein
VSHHQNMLRAAADHVERHGLYDEARELRGAADRIDSLERALRSIASGDCWNARETARFALTGANEGSESEGTP